MNASNSRICNWRTKQFTCFEILLLFDYSFFSVKFNDIFHVLRNSHHRSPSWTEGAFEPSETIDCILPQKQKFLVRGECVTFYDAGNRKVQRYLNTMTDVKTSCHVHEYNGGIYYQQLLILSVSANFNRNSEAASLHEISTPRDGTEMASRKGLKCIFHKKRIYGPYTIKTSNGSGYFEMCCIWLQTNQSM
jgi:hypothetical protein